MSDKIEQNLEKEVQAGFESKISIKAIRWIFAIFFGSKRYVEITRLKYNLKQRLK